MDLSAILLESLRWGGGVRIFWRGVREKGGSDEPPEPPPGDGPDSYHFESKSFLFLADEKHNAQKI